MKTQQALSGTGAATYKLIEPYWNNMFSKKIKTETTLGHEAKRLLVDNHQGSTII